MNTENNEMFKLRHFSISLKIFLEIKASRIHKTGMLQN